MCDKSYISVNWIKNSRKQGNSFKKQVKTSKIKKYNGAKKQEFNSRLVMA